MIGISDAIGLALLSSSSSSLSSCVYRSSLTYEYRGNEFIASVLICFLVLKIPLLLQHSQPMETMVLLVIILVTTNTYIVVADIFNIHHLPRWPVRARDPSFSAIDFGRESYITDHPNSTIFTNHEIRYVTNFLFPSLVLVLFFFARAKEYCVEGSV